MELKESVLGMLNQSFSLRGDGVLRYLGRLCVPNVDRLRNRILKEAHVSLYIIHPGLIKMCHLLREVFWWKSLKNDIAEFIAKCPNGQQVKAEHKKSGCLLQ